MKLAFWQHLAVLTVLGLGATNFNSAALAAQFEQQEIDQSRFIVLAAPGGDIGYKLLILEQINSNRPCWSETGSNPSNVDPLLLNFDFTGICNRLVDSNSFSVRTAGEDQALQYSLRIIKQGNDLVLVAASNTDRNALVEIGRTNGLPTGFSRIVLNPGWRLTRRTFNGRALGHVYLTYDQPIDVLVASSRRNVPLGSQSPTTILNPPSEPDNTDLDSTDSDTTDSDTTETLDTPSNLETPDVTPTEPRPDTSVIPVPSLPPAISTTPAPTTPAPLPPVGTTRPITPPRTGTAPNLSTILPRPSATPNATTNQSATQTPAQPTPDSTAAQPETDANDTPILPPPPPVLTAPASGSSSSGSSSSTSTPRASSPQASRTSNSASSSTTTRQPTGVPQVSNSGGAPLRPRSLRREEPLPSQTGQASGTSRSNSSSSSTSSSSTRSTPSSTARNSATGGSSSSSSTTVAEAETYQVIVVADNAEAQDKVREIVPDAFLTTINGQVVMQVGVFQDRQEADQLQQRLSLEGLSTAVISVR